MKRHLLHILSHLLPLLFATYLCSFSLFTHTHEVNGVVVVHSHPFKDGHAHTPQQFETIWQLTHTFLPELTVFNPSLGFVPVVLGLLWFPRLNCRVCWRTVCHRNLRAPPYSPF